MELCLLTLDQSTVSRWVCVSCHVTESWHVVTAGTNSWAWRTEDRSMERWVSDVRHRQTFVQWLKQLERLQGPLYCRASMTSSRTVSVLSYCCHCGAMMVMMMMMMVVVCRRAWWSWQASSECMSIRLSTWRHFPPVIRQGSSTARCQPSDRQRSTCPHVQTYPSLHSHLCMYQQLSVCVSLSLCLIGL